MEETTATLLAFLIGLLGGGGLGLAARLGKFCTLAAIEDALFAHNYTRWRMWVLAIAVAIVAVYLAESLGLIDPRRALVISDGFNPVATIVGGFIFGIGMALVGTCGFGTIVRLGGGDLKSLVVFLVLGISAFMAASGPTALMHLWVFEPLKISAPLFQDPRIHVLLAKLTGIGAAVFPPLIAAVLVAWVLANGKFRSRFSGIVWGIWVGLIIASGWIGTGWLVQDPFDPRPMTSFSFVRPVGNTLMYAMTSTSSQLGFGIGGVVGVLIGAFAGALIKSEWRWQTHDDPHEAKRQIVGAFLMGTGGMFALGCTFGQGLSAASLLAISAPLALASIWLGSWLGLLVLMEGGVSEFIRSLPPIRSSHKTPAE